MKKQELIHLHGLLAEVHNHYQQEVDVEVKPEQYAELGCRPTSIHKSKTDHKEAVFALANGLTRQMDEETTKTPTASAD